MQHIAVYYYTEHKIWIINLSACTSTSDIYVLSVKRDIQKHIWSTDFIFLRYWGCLVN